MLAALDDLLPASHPHFRQVEVHTLHLVDVEHGPKKWDASSALVIFHYILLLLCLSVLFAFIHFPVDDTGTFLAPADAAAQLAGLPEGEEVGRLVVVLL
ncbi:hypothetical protein [Pontibacter mangrovi]|uniref:hypothetical protein n=1 Tax=Pontibacter mangrovi TaxID=2589816 RepID=UPI001EEFAE9A|nr:hypothetical protein [Pontibacter mangrovi]